MKFWCLVKKVRHSGFLCMEVSGRDWMQLIFRTTRRIRLLIELALSAWGRNNTCRTGLDYMRLEKNEAFDSLLSLYWTAVTYCWWGLTILSSEHWKGLRSEGLSFLSKIKTKHITGTVLYSPAISQDAIFLIESLLRVALYHFDMLERVFLYSMDD